MPSCLQHFEVGSDHLIVKKELTGCPPVHACLKIKMFMIFMMLLFILGKLSKECNVIRNIFLYLFLSLLHFFYQGNFIVVRK